MQSSYVRPRRPTGVTILGVLDILGGVLLLIGGIITMAAGLAIGTLVSTAEINNQLAASGYPQLQSFVSSGMFATFLIIAGVVSLVSGILALACGIGFFSGRSWAWTLGMIGAVLGIVWSIVQIVLGNYGGVLILIVDAVIFYYLTRPHVKAFFGKGPMVGPTAPYPSGPPTSTGPSPQ